MKRRGVTLAGVTSDFLERAASRLADVAVTRIARGQAPLALPIVVCDRCVESMKDWRARLGVVAARGLLVSAGLPVQRIATCERCAGHNGS